MDMPTWLRALWPFKARRDNYAATYGNGSAGGFAGGGVSRLTASLATWSGSVNMDLDGSLVILRARARQLAQSNEYGRRFLSLAATNIVGATGPKLQVRAYKDQRAPNKPTVLDKSANDAIEIHYERWFKQADITGRMTLPHLYRTAIKGVARDGEALIRIVRDRTLPYGIALQLLEADRLADTINQMLPGGAVIRQGVELDGRGRPVAYYIRTRHPGDRYSAGPTDIERVPAKDIIHLFLPERAEQVRGYTWFHAILLRAAQLHGFNEAAVTAARIGASKIAALERAEEAPDLTASMADGTSGGNFQMNVEAGEMFELPPGYKLSSWNPEYPHANFESFVKTAMRGISSGLDVATHNLSGDMTDVNYSSARIAEMTERDMWVTLQGWFIAAAVEPVYQEWLASAMLRGDVTFEISGKALPADKLGKFANASRFRGRRWAWVDPAKEIRAKQEAVDLGVTSRTRIAAEQGDDIEDVIDELAQEQDMLDAAGLVPAAPAPGAPPAPAAKPQDDEVKQLRVLLRDLEQRMNAVAPSAPTFVIRNEMPPTTPTPVEIRNEITTPAPQVDVQVAAPVVNVAAPTVEVQVEARMPEQVAPVVEVKVELPDEMKIGALPARKTNTSVTYNAAGDVLATETIETDI